MYKISNDIIHVNKSKYLTPATETRTRRSYGLLNILLNMQATMYLNTPILLEQWGTRMASFLILYLPNL